jgi:tRNA nucleotidyltransferase (CCA-adding enzyme)
LRNVLNTLPHKVSKTMILPLPYDPDVRERWECWAANSAQPSTALQALADSGQLVLFPELAALQGTPQDPEWHPEGDVWIHTLLVCDQAALIARRDGLSARETGILVFAALCHDLGKPMTTVFQAGRWRAPMHAQVGVPISVSFLQRIGIGQERIDIIKPLVAEHLVHVQPVISAAAVRRLLKRLEPASFPQLIRLIQADLRGRPPLAGELPDSVRQLQSRVQGLPVCNRRPVPEIPALVMGRHLLELGQEPGPAFREILDKCLQAQIAGAFTDEPGAMEFVRRLLQGS